MKIAIISDNHFNDKKGAFNAAHNRIKYLKRYPEFEIDCFLILEYENWFIRKLRGSKKIEKIECYDYDGVVYNILWVNFSLLSYIIRVKFKKFPDFLLMKYSKYVDCFSEYKHISAHSTIPGALALKVKNKYPVSYSVTWHGSEIHSESKYNKGIEKLVSKIILNAKNNFFVSIKLLEDSPSVNQCSKMVLYNGVNTDVFFKQTDSVKHLLREKYQIVKKRNVAYVGNLIYIKNSNILPDFFSVINQSIEDIQFHVVGDGDLRKNIENECNKGTLNVKFYGNLHPNDIPDIINCMDLVVLPSLNEGMPLIILEALACGTPVIGSNVGGISEVLGFDNVVELNEDFVSNFAKLAINKLNVQRNVTLPVQFNWCETAKLESEIYLKENKL